MTWIESFSTNCTQSRVFGGCQSGILLLASPRICSSPPTLPFYINDLPDDISSQIRVFADDCIIYLELSSAKSPEQHQSDLDSLSVWAGKWQMRFNWSKCYSMHITRSRSQVITTYFLNNRQALEVADSHPYLGVIISSDLHLDKHCDYVVNKRTKILNLSLATFITVHVRLRPSYISPLCI